MKVVDEKGKLFGKLNIIDLLVIILILAAVVVVGVKVLGASGRNEGNGETSTAAKLTYTVRVTGQREEIADWLTEYIDASADKKDQLMAGGEMVDAYIVDYWTEPIRYKWIANGYMEAYDSETAKEAGVVDLCFVIEANVVDMKTNLVGSQEVRVGKSHIVKTTHLEFSGGIIESCTWEPTE